MAKTIWLNCINTAVSTTANTTQYWMLPAVYVAPTTTEANAQQKIYTAGKFTNLRLRLTANGVAADSTFRFRNNTADGNQVVTCTASTTGVFEDTSNSDDVAVDDLIDIKSVPGAATGTMSLTVLACTFDTTTSTSDTISSLVIGNSTGNTTATAASTTTYLPMHTDLGAQVFVGGNLQAWEQGLQGAAGTYKKLRIKLTANSRASDSTLRFRKNGANGSQVVTVTANTTGIFIDSSNTDAVVAADKVNYTFVTGTGTSAQTIMYVACEFQTTTDPGTGLYVSSSSVAGASTQSKNLTYFFGIAGLSTSGATESNTQITAKEAYTFHHLSIDVISYPITATSSLTLRVAGADSALTVPITSGSSGWLTDTTHNVTVAAANLLGMKLLTANYSGSSKLYYNNIFMAGDLAGTAGAVTCTVTGKSNTNKFIIKA